MGDAEYQGQTHTKHRNRTIGNTVSVPEPTTLQAMTEHSGAAKTST